MATASELLNELFTRAGVDVEDETLKKIVTNGDLLKLTVPDDMATAIQSKLHTLESAKAVLKPALKKEITAELYNGVDSELYDLATEYGVDGTQLKTLSKTSERLKTLASKIKELSAKADDSTGKEKKDLIEQINALKADKATLSQTHQTEIANVRKEADTEVTNFALVAHLKGYNYVNDKAGKDANAKLASILLNDRIASLNAVAKYDKKLGKVTLVSQDGTVVYDSTNKPITFETLSDQVVAENNLIKTSEASGAGARGGNGGVTTTKSGRPGAGDFDSQMNDLISEARKVTQV